MRERVPKTFVASRMQSLAALFFPQIERMWYLVEADTKEEYVIVEYDERPNSEIKRIGHFQICVTADSPETMVDDVWKGLKRKFG